MRVIIAFALLALCVQGATVPCGQANEQRLSKPGSGLLKTQGFYASPDTISAVLSSLSLFNNVAASVAVGWVELEGAADAYLFVSLNKINQSEFRVLNSISGAPTYASLGVNVQSTTNPSPRYVITLAADGDAFSGWAALPFTITPTANGGTVPTDVDSDISLSTAPQASIGRYLLKNGGLAELSGAALNAVQIEDLTAGNSLTLTDSVSDPPGAFYVRNWRPCPTGCVDAKGDACTSITKDDDCTSVKAESGASTCVSLKFTTSGASC